MSAPYLVLVFVFLRKWGARLTWIVQRECAAQIFKTVDTTNAASAFMASLYQEFDDQTSTST